MCLLFLVNSTWFHISSNAVAFTYITCGLNVQILSGPLHIGPYDFRDEENTDGIAESSHLQLPAVLITNQALMQPVRMLSTVQV